MTDVLPATIYRLRGEREREDFGGDHNMVFRRNRGGSVVANIVYRSYYRKLILNEGDH